MLSRRIASALFACVLCPPPAAALAQAAPPPAARTAAATTVAPVTVTAPAKPRVIEKQASAFVLSYAAAQNPEIGQIGRWRDPVCVQVVGLPQPDEAAKIQARIESVAQAVGLPAARAGCTANVEIVFSAEPQRIMDIVAQRHEFLLGYYHTHDHDRLKQVTRPIQAWYVTATRGNGEGASALALNGLRRYAQYRTEVIDDPQNAPPTGCGDSRLTTSCLESVFNNVFIVADSKATEGRDLGMVADYLVMLALSQPRSLDGCNAMASVLDAFAKSACPGREPPDGLTPPDAAYLTALYGTDLDAKTKVEESDIADRMARILIKANAAGR
jgi:hypothetical protein